MKISEMMTKNVRTIDRNEPASAALALMEEHNIRHLVVTHSGKPESIVSDRDLLVVLSISNEEGANPVTVGQISTRHPITLKPDSTVLDAAKYVLDKKVSAFPVLDDQQVLVGIITTHDLIRLLIKNLS